MLGSYEGAMVDAAVETVTAPPLGNRTLCGVCVDPIAVVEAASGPVWVHIAPTDGSHRATPVEAAPAPVRITCPGLGCREPAWRLPDGAVYCTRTRMLVRHQHPAEEVRPAGPDEPSAAELAAEDSRLALVRGLREAAGWLADHPEAPLIRYPELLATPDSRADVQRAAEVAGVEMKVSPTGHATATLTFGPMTLRWAHVSGDAMARHRALMSYQNRVQPAGGEQR